MGGQTPSLGDGLWLISPLDGRYRQQLASLGPYMSEGALILYRVKVECAWLRFLSKQAEKGLLFAGWRLSSQEEAALFALEQPHDASALTARVKAIEATTNHDVKAVEYVMRESLQAVGASPQSLALIHFACTSEDINNLAYALMLRDATSDLLLPAWQETLHLLAEMSRRYGALPMLARTHGQPATPTTLGKEIAVFGYRLLRQWKALKGQEYNGKINGAVGNFNAHHVVAPHLNWPDLCRSFVESQLGLTWNPWTTQIESHDFIAEWCGKVHLYNTIATDLVRDIWTYISLGYFKQKLAPHEVGSSTMPHKVNPIDFENAEGNYGLASALASHFAGKLPISRLQRDLSDSTVLRSLGMLLGYHLLAQNSLRKGLGKIAAEPRRLHADLGEAWEVLGEPLQSLLRSQGVADAYELVKEKTRGKRLGKDEFARLCQELAPSLPVDAQQRLAALTPSTYVGLAPQLAQEFYELVAHELPSELK